ncbi:transcriptional regulator [Streptomyces clavuligerus]|uniref:transcriptional regulator n=1 Tax=Streptomyces clavuligerus TaxID=1901 RepID=UPI0018D1D56B|nr:transcriptional regulator [Streptomyces clavuligerus]
MTPVTTADIDAAHIRLEPAAREVYRLLAAGPARSITPGLAAAACGMEPGTAAQHLEELARARLLTTASPDGALVPCYRFPQAARLHARQLPAADERVCSVALERLADWTLACARAAQDLLTPAQAALARTLPVPPAPPVPFTDATGALAWLEGQHDNLLPLLDALTGHEKHTMVWRLTDAFWPYFHRCHPYELWTAAHTRALVAVCRTGHPAAERQMLLAGAAGHAASGNHGEAVDGYTRAQAAARAAGDQRDEGRALLGLGTARLDSGHPAKAAPLLRKAIVRWTQCGHERGVSLALTALAGCSLPQDPEQAIRHLTRAHETLTAEEDSHHAACALALRGHARSLAGYHRQALEDLSRARDVLNHGGGGPLEKARALEFTAATHTRRGDAPAIARPWYERAAAVYDRFRPTEAAHIRHQAGLPEPAPDTTSVPPGDRPQRAGTRETAGPAGQKETAPAGRPHHTSSRFDEDLELRLVSGPPRYARSTDRPVKYLIVVCEHGDVIGYLWANDEDRAAGWCRRESQGGHAFNLGQRWVAALRDAKRRGLTPVQALEEILDTSDARLPSHIACPSFLDAPDLQALKDLAART